MRRFSFILAAIFFPVVAVAQENPESFRFELTASAWLVGPTGNLRADGTPVDFVKDLAAGAQDPHFYGSLVFKPARKHRIFVEGSPVGFSGRNTIDSTFVFGSRTYTVSQTVVSNAQVNYAVGGYQYDPLSGPAGHLGFQIGVAYLGVNGTLTGIQSGITESKSYDAPLPLIGTEFRLFPIPHHQLIQLEGMVRGLPAGGYGYFVEGGAAGGIRIWHFALLAGYREMLADVHEDKPLGNGVFLHLKGPIFSLQSAW